mmetsp:Transcript_3227/g.5862  ORF Transcript_3227/g.5862 Transcript_3227/m.5862 type:complete len:85 (-) Transcript_3227:398-652(-)
MPAAVDQADEAVATDATDEEVVVVDVTVVTEAVEVVEDVTGEEEEDAAVDVDAAAEEAVRNKVSTSKTKMPFPHYKKEKDNGDT